MANNDIAYKRLFNQRLLNSKFKNAEEVVSWLGAVQSQEYDGGKWGIGLRIPGSTEKDIEKSIVDRKIVRTWPMRGTIHFVTAADVHWWVKLLAPRINKRLASYYKKLELTEEVFSKTRKILEKEMHGGNQLTRPEIYKLFEDQKIRTKGMRGLFIIGHLAQDSIICGGVKKGKQPTFTLLDEWVPKKKMLEHDEALGEVTLRYFQSHGPATIQDFMGWSALNMSEVKIGLEIMKDKIDNDTIDGRDFYFVGDNKVSKKPECAYLLGAYDEYTVAYKDRSDIIEKENVSKVFVANGFYSMIVVDGNIVGSWRREVAKDKFIVQTKIFEKLTSSQMKLVEKEAKHFCDFFGVN